MTTRQGHPPASAPPESRASRLCADGSAVAVLVAVLVASNVAPRMYAMSTAPLRCHGAEPEVCLLGAYERFEPEVRRRFEPALATWRAIGGPPVARLSMAQVDPDRPVGAAVSLPTSVVTDRTEAWVPIGLVLDAAIGDCRFRRVTPWTPVDDSLVRWLHDRFAGPTRKLGSSADPWFGRDDVAQVAWARAQMASVLDRCA